MNPQDYCATCLRPKETGGKCHLCGTPDQIQFPPGHLPPGTQLAGRYLIGSALGQGGFGITYRARDLVLERIVAIKEYFPRDLSNRADDGVTVQSSEPTSLDAYRLGMERFIEEGRVLARFTHPSIVQLRDVFQEHGTVYIVMEYLDGMTLREYLRGEGGQVRYDTALSMLAPIFDGMREVHSNGLLHRDISPDNIFITRSAQVKLLDFGSSKNVASGNRTTQMILKDGYSPPEQYRTSGEEGPWTDVYALGATLYNAITGRIPPGAMERMIDDKLLPPSELGVEISREAEIAILRSLAVSRQDRFAGLEEFQSALARGGTNDHAISSVPVLQETLLEPRMPATGYSPSIRTPPTRYADSVSSAPGPPRRRSWKLLAGLIVVLVLAALFFVFYFSASVRAPDSVPVFATPASEPKTRVVLLAAMLLALLGATATIWARLTKRRSGRRGGALTPEPQEAKYAPVEHTRWVLPASAELLAADAGNGANARQHMYTRIFEAGPGESLAEASRFQHPPDDTVTGRGGGGRPRVGLTFFAAPDPGLIGRSMPIDNVPFSIGRSPVANIAVQGDNGVSREHCRIDWKDTAYTVRDLDTVNGTWLNGRKILSDNPEVLMFGASIRLTHLTGLTFVSLDASELPDLTGNILHNRYRLMGRLRSGTRTALYKAEDQRVARTVAIKILCPPLAAYHGYLEHLNREAQLAAKLQHPRIAKVWDCGLGEIDAPEGNKLRVHYVCTEFMGGGSLADRLHERQPQTIAEVAGWLEPVAEALDHAHRNDVVHNGLKATSIVFDQSAQPYITDFAFASEAGRERQRIFLGAPEFMAPEQWEGQPSTHATDQYALAAVIYYAVTGVMPYENQQDPDTRRRNYERGLTPLHEETSRRGTRAVPIAVSGVIARAMAIDPIARYASLAEFAKAFREAIAGKGESHLVFLSYRRDCSAAWAELFSLKLMNHGVSSFIDTELQDSKGYFPSSLERAIEQCGVFVCFLAANTLESAWVREEIRLASAHGKTMIPVLQEDFASPEVSAQEEEWMRSLLGHQGVHLLDRKNIYVDETVARLAKMILERA